MSKRLFAAAIVLAPIFMISQRPARAAAMEAPAVEASESVMAGLPAAGSIELAGAVDRLIGGLRPDLDPARFERVIGSRMESGRPQVDVQAAKAVLAALQDPEQAKRLMGELAAVQGGAGARASQRLEQFMERAASHRAAMAQAAAAASPGGAVYDGSDGKAAPEAGATDAGRASGLKPSVRAFKNETAAVPFAEFLDRLYAKSPIGAKNIAANVFTDLTEQDPLPFAGRAKTAGEVLEVLSRDFGEKTSVRLIGTLGSGRKTVIDHIAAGIRSGVYDLDIKVLELDLPRLARLYTLPAPKGGGDAPFEVFLKEVLPGLAERSVIVVRGAERLLDGDANQIMQMLERPMERTGQRFIFVFEDESKLPKGHFLRKFTERVELPKLDERAATQLLLAHKTGLESRSGVKILDTAIEELVSLSNSFLNRLHPQELIDNLVRAVGEREQRTQRNKAQATINDLYSQLALTAAKHRRTRGVKEYNEVIRLAKALDDEQGKLRAEQAQALTGEHVKDSLARQYPEKENLIRGGKSFKKRLLEAIPKLKERIIGQDEAVALVSKVLKEVSEGMEDDKGTLGGFLFLGPTGVGKTEIAKALAEAYSGNEKNLIRLDMSEYKERVNVSRMTGPPPGYAGYDEGGALTNAVDERPESVVVYDEIEKGHMDTYDLLLQLLDDGRLTNGQGKTVDFHRTINILTSNIGSDIIVQMVDAGKSDEEISEAVQKLLLTGWSTDDGEGRKITKKIKPELLNRLSGIVVFKPLGRPIVIKIGELQTKMAVAAPLAKNGHELMPLGEGVLDYLADKRGGYNRAMGARPMLRAIRSSIKDRVTEFLGARSEKGEEGKLNISVKLDGDEIVVAGEPKIAPELEKSPLPEGKLGEWARSLLNAGESSDLSAEAVQGSYEADVRAPVPAPAPPAPVIRRMQPVVLPEETARKPVQPEPPRADAVEAKAEGGMTRPITASDIVDEVNLTIDRVRARIFPKRGVR